MERHEFEKLKGFLLLSWDAARSESDPNSSEGATVVFSTCRANAPTARAPIVELDNFQLPILPSKTREFQKWSRKRSTSVGLITFIAI
jgi:hypothetical protein